MPEQAFSNCLLTLGRAPFAKPMNRFPRRRAGFGHYQRIARPGAKKPSS
jgi:hypothetical protein